MTWVRGLLDRINRKEVITEYEFSEMIKLAEEIQEVFYRLRATALLCLLRLTGKRRSEMARLELSDIKLDKNYLHVTFTLSKKRKATIITKRSPKTIPLTDPLTKPIIQYLDYLQELPVTPTFLFAQTKMLWGQGYIILGDKSISGRQIFNIVRQVTDKAWPHLFRESAASDIVKTDPSIIGAFKVQRRLDLEDVKTGFNYVRRFASDVIQREIGEVKA